jgi:hypothetical protein
MKTKEIFNHNETCDHCPHDNNREECNKVSILERGFKCCQCPECFPIEELLKKEMDRNNALVRVYVKKPNVNAASLIIQDIGVAAYALDSKDRTDMIAAYKVLKNNV